MSRLADISVAIAEWVVGALQTQELATALKVQNPNKVLDRIWDAPPDDDADLPYILIQVSEPRDVGGFGMAEVMASAEVTVKAVGQEESYEPLQPVAIGIHHALQGKMGAPISGGGTLLSCRRVRTVSYPEESEGVEYRHLGGTYAVNAQ